MKADLIFDPFLKDQLGFLKGGYDRAEFADIKPAIDRATALGYLDLNETAESFPMLCSLLQKSAAWDGGFAMTVFVQSAVRMIFRSAGFKMEGLVAFQPFQNALRDDSLRFIKKNGYALQGTARAVALAEESSHALFLVDGRNYFLLDLSRCKKVDRVGVLGLRTLPLYDLTLEAAEVTLVGAEDDGHAHYSKMARPFRIAASAMMHGVLQAAYGAAVSYGHERVQGGRKIIEWSEHKMMLARVFSRLLVCETLLAHGIAQGEKLTESESLSTFIHFQECLAEMTSSSMQAMGGAGYMKDYPLERFYRDGHQLRCLFGTAPFHKLDLFSREGMNV